jgi:hypothetical protein
MTKNRLIPQEASESNKTLIGRLYILMLNVEESLITAGAKPGEDYTYNDLMDHAIKLYTAGKDIEMPGLEIPN